MSKLLKIKAIIFDVDGTLLDTKADILATVNLLREEYGLDSISMTQVLPFIGQGLGNLIERFFGVQLQAYGKEKLHNRYRDLYLATTDPSGSAYPGVEDTLHKLMQYTGLSLGVCTNRRTDTAHWLLEKALPNIRFDFVGGYDAVSERKPSPRHLLELIERRQHLPHETWYLGDHEVDRQSAEGAGIHFLGACYGFGGVEVDDSRKITEFPKILEKLPLPVL